MKKLLNLGGALLFASFILTGCSTILKESSIQRPIERYVSHWEVVGNVRLEILVAQGEINLATPYDQLLKKAHEKYGEMADVIEIKVEKQTLTLAEKMSIRKEQKKSYAKRFIYNAVVIVYTPTIKGAK